MRRGRARRWSLAAGTVTALLLAGCGIRETDVIEAGGPATVGYVPNPGVDALLFFRLPHGELVPVVRPLGTFGDGVNNFRARPASTEKVLAALLSGPKEAEKAAGISSSLPLVVARMDRLRVAGGNPGAWAGTGSGGLSGSGSGSGTGSGDESGEVTVGLPFEFSRLDATAVRQLICTTAYSKNRDGRATVRLKGTDGGTTSGTCELAHNTGSAPKAAGTVDGTERPEPAGPVGRSEIVS
ncbi:hypothetical protein ACFYVL_00760 [Streptomyces sp. NPDC004111]|uniref:hypothetical protein n=1 Tax=Streptomyces sp. NPDC004111 TaxID=3364690 RepID=UPI0036B42EB4